MAKKRTKKKSFLFKGQKISLRTILVVILVVCIGGMGTYYVAHATTKTYYYSSSGIGHPDSQQGGHAVCVPSCQAGGHLTVWQSAVSPPTYSWIGPNNASQSSGFKSVCFSLRALRASHLHLVAYGKKPGALGKSFIQEAFPGVSKGSTFHCVPLKYTLKSSYTELEWDLDVQDGQVQINKVSAPS